LESFNRNCKNLTFLENRKFEKSLLGFFRCYISHGALINSKVGYMFSGLAVKRT